MKSRLPSGVFLLALGTSLMCTSEYLIAGLLEQRSADSGVSLATTGLLITGFTGGMIIGAPAVIATLVVAVTAMVAFVIVQARGDHPMMPLQLFRSKGFRIALSVGFAFMVGNYFARV